MSRNNKIIYVANIDESCSKGYANKIKAMCSAFSSHGYDTELLIKNKKSAKYYDEKGKELSTFSLINSLLSLYIGLIYVCVTKKTNVVYFRHPRCNPFFIILLALIKLLPAKPFMVYEIPTYPYDQEYNCCDFRCYFKKYMDKISRQFLKYFVNLVVIIGSNVSNVFGIPAITIDNGVDTSDYQPHVLVPVEKELVIIGVGNISLRHGYDRVIKGMYNYYNSGRQVSVNVLFHIVGDGEELDVLNDLSAAKGLSDKVIFKGAVFGRELDFLFSGSHIAVGNLAFHRVNVKSSSALKEREYMARGIPFICVGESQMLNDISEHVIRIPDDEQPVDIDNLLSFYLGYNTKSINNLELRNYAAINLSWDNKVKKVIATFPC